MIETRNVLCIDSGLVINCLGSQIRWSRFRTNFRFLNGYNCRKVESFGG